MNSCLHPIHIISVISREIPLKLTWFSLKITNIGKIVIDGFHGSHKWWNIKSNSNSIHANFDHNPSLVNMHLLHEMGSSFQTIWYFVPTFKASCVHISDMDFAQFFFPVTVPDKPHAQSSSASHSSLIFKPFANSSCLLYVLHQFIITISIWPLVYFRTAQFFFCNSWTWKLNLWPLCLKVPHWVD